MDRQACIKIHITLHVALMLQPCPGGENSEDRHTLEENARKGSKGTSFVPHDLSPKGQIRSYGYSRFVCLLLSAFFEMLLAETIARAKAQSKQ